MKVSARRWKEARRSRAAERVASGGGAPRALRNATPRLNPRVTRIFATAVILLLGSSSTVFACPVCFGAEETSMIDATKLGILVLLSITIAVQGAFVGFFVYLRKRAKRMAEMDLDAEWSQLQRGPSRTS